MPKRKLGWVPALTHLKKRGMGRVRLPNQPDIYFGPPGVWPAKQKTAPREVEEAYRKVIAAWVAAGGANASGPVRVGGKGSGGLLVAELAAAYLAYTQEHYQKRGKPTGEHRKTKVIYDVMKKLFASLLAADFGPKESRAVRDELLRTGTRKRETVSEHGTRLRAMFSWGEMEGMVPESVAMAVRGTRWFAAGQTGGGKVRKKPVPIEDVEKTLPHLSSMVRAMVEVHRRTGMRPQEVCMMRVSDITDDGDGLWTYEARDDANKLAHRGIPKIVLLGPRCQEILRPYLSAARKRGGDGWLFPTRRGTGITPRHYGRLVREACERAGVTPWSPGRLRHSRLTETMKRYGIDGAQAEAGHLSPNMTRRYTSAAQDDLVRKIAKESG